ncbi:MAG: PEP-CTERM sorting domain-containing protein [Planctomycetes bacterium]|nr:PEP-CTERM sorting domain-containing protein [Planctomycetota bacterium]
MPNIIMGKHSCLASACWFVAFSLSMGAPSFAEITYFQGLGSSQSRALGVSPDGSTVIGYKQPAGRREAMRWEGGQSFALGHLPNLPGSVRNSLARAASASGVTVGRSTSAASGPGLFEAFRWEGGTMAGLGDLPGGTFYSEAWGVSANGSIVVGRATSSSGTEAFRWEDGQMHGLGDLPGGSFSSAARDVSASGSVVVGAATSASGSEAFRWENGNMTGLGDLPGGNFDSDALAVSANGTVVVGVSSGASGQSTAFRWEDGLMTDLGTLPGGSGPSIARAVSADGSVIIGDAAMDNSSALEPFIFTPDKGMRSLSTVLEELGIDTSDWILSLATGVSDDGRTIVGYGTRISPFVQREAWIAVVPEPNTFALLLLGSLVIARPRRRMN